MAKFMDFVKALTGGGKPSAATTATAATGAENDEDKDPKDDEDAQDETPGNAAPDEDPKDDANPEDPDEDKEKGKSGADKPKNASQADTGGHAHFQRLAARFGAEFAAHAFGQRLDYVQSLEMHDQALAAENADLRQRLHSLGKAGEANPPSASGLKKEADAKPAGRSNHAAWLAQGLKKK